MTSKSRHPPASLFVLRLKAALVLCTPALAYAAEEVVQHTRRGSLEEIPAITWLFLAGFSMLGWAVSELDKVAELWNTDGRSRYEIWKQRLALLKGVAASNAAGLLIYIMGSAAPAFFFRAIGVQGSPEFPEMVLFVFVSGAGYMGVRWFAWVERKWLT